MKNSKFNGKYTKAFLSEELFNEENMEGKILKKILKKQVGEAVYVYSFKENKLLYVEGFKELVGIENNKLSITKLNTLYTDEFMKFTNEYHDRALLYLYNNKYIDSFDSSIIMKIPNVENPVLLNIKVFSTDSNGNLTAVIGKILFNNSLKTTDVVQYKFDGEFDEKFNFKMNHELDFLSRISDIEIRLIDYIEKEKSMEYITKKLAYSKEQIELIVANLMKRFNLNSQDELIKFAYANFCLPNQFEKFGRNE